MYATRKTVKKNRKIEVKQLQALLHLLGQPIAVDGVLGNNSKKAIKHFQQQHQLSADGVVGKGTWMVLYKAFEQFMNGLCDKATSLDTRGCQAFGTEKSPFVDVDSNSSDTATVSWLQALLHILDDNTQVSGRFDTATENKIKAVQQQQALTVNAKVDESTWDALFIEGAKVSTKIANLFLTDDYIAQKAKEEGVEPAAIKAVVKVESGGAGFYSNGDPKILFEGHIFWQQLKEVGINPVGLQAANEDIIYQKWTKSHYTGQAIGEYDRLARAKAINEEAALKSASWGMFQIMGFNAGVSGFDQVTDFVSSMSESEERQLDAFFAFLHHENIFKYLKNKDWAGFARRYNGSQFKKNQYDSKLQVAFDAASGVGTRGVDGSLEDMVVNEYSRQLAAAFADFEGEK